MLSSRQKINSQDFRGFLKKGKKKSSKNFKTSLVFGGDGAISQYSVIINKKTAKTAVLRNKNKRMIYKMISQLYPQFPLIKYGFVFIQKDITQIDKNELQTELIQHFKNK